MMSCLSSASLGEEVTYLWVNTREDGVAGDFSLHSQEKSIMSPDSAGCCSTCGLLWDSRMSLCD